MTNQQEQDLYLKRLIELLARDFRTETKRTSQFYNKIYADFKKHFKEPVKVKQTQK